MTQFTLETARNLTNADLIGALKTGLSMAEDGIRHAAVAVTVLEERNVDVSMLPETFRHSRDIAEGTLSAHAAWLLARIPFAVNAIKPLPIDKQDKIADGLPIRIAALENDRIVYREKTIFQMSQAQIRFIFSDDGIASDQEQGEWLLKTRKAVDVSVKTLNAPKVSVDAATGEIVVNRTHVSIDELTPALAALGYQVKSIYGAKKMTPAKVR